MPFALNGSVRSTFLTSAAATDAQASVRATAKPTWWATIEAPFTRLLMDEDRWRKVPLYSASSPSTVRSPSAPDLPCGLDDERQLLLFVVDGHRVAHEVARETTLRTETQLIERQELRRLVDAAFDHVLGLQHRRLGGNQAEDDVLALGDVAQRREVARAVGVVLHEVVWDVDIPQHDFADVLVAAASHPLAAVVAAAHVHP